jgi:predicted Zn finger-like uncharacterized protein
MPFTTSCSACQNSLAVPDAAVGRQVRCPVCGQVWTVSRPLPAVASFLAACPSCRNSLQVPGEAVGRQARCPVCGYVWAIAPPAAAAARPRTRFDALMEDDHPATRPQAVGETPASRPREAYRLWQDEKYLVVDVRSCVFPSICVKTGEPTGSTTRVKLAWLDPSGTLGVAIVGGFALGILGPIGKLAGRVYALWEIERRKTRFSLRVGVSSKWLARRRIMRWIAWVAVTLGLLVLVIGALNASHGPGPGKNSTQVTVVAVLVTLLLGGGAAVLGHTGQRSVLGVHTMDGDYAWLVGAHEDFLDRLEPWDE